MSSTGANSQHKHPKLLHLPVLCMVMMLSWREPSPHSWKRFYNLSPAHQVLAKTKKTVIAANMPQTKTSPDCCGCLHITRAACWLQLQGKSWACWTVQHLMGCWMIYEACEVRWQWQVPGLVADEKGTVKAEGKSFWCPQITLLRLFVSVLAWNWLMIQLQTYITTELCLNMLFHRNKSQRRSEKTFSVENMSQWSKNFSEYDLVVINMLNSVLFCFVL